jgi:hypothetical protein
MSEVELYRFAKWVAKEVCQDNFADNADAFAEIACRKLYYLGIIEKDGAWWSCKEEGE